MKFEAIIKHGADNFFGKKVKAVELLISKIVNITGSPVTKEYQVPFKFERKIEEVNINLL